MKNLLGGEEGLADSGISVSKLILNPLLFLEATGEVYQGQNALFSSSKRSDLAYVGRLRGYRDVTEGDQPRRRRVVRLRPQRRRADDLTTRVIGIDATVRYRPLRRAIYRRFLGRTELFWSRRGEAAGDRAGVRHVWQRRTTSSRGAGSPAARYDWSERADDSSLVDKGPSLLLTYWPSEFSQIRGQYRRTRYAEGVNVERVAVPVPVLDRRARRACVLDEVEP